MIDMICSTLISIYCSMSELFRFNLAETLKIDKHINIDTYIFSKLNDMKSILKLYFDELDIDNIVTAISSSKLEIEEIKKLTSSLSADEMRICIDFAHDSIKLNNGLYVYLGEEYSLNEYTKIFENNPKTVILDIITRR